MTRKQAIMTYKSRAKLLLAYKRQVMAVDAHRAYKALALAQTMNAYANNLINMSSAEYALKRYQWQQAVHNNAANTAPNQLSLF